MKAVHYQSILWVAVAALTAWTQLAAARDIPQLSYACHVTTSTGYPGVVLVQVNNITEAFEVARRNPATTLDGTHAKTADVVECILPDKQTFSDAGFQQSFDQMGR
jgi:hypothetical protein